VTMNMEARIVSIVLTRKMLMMVVGIVSMMMRTVLMMRSSRLGTGCECEKTSNHDKKSKHDARPNSKTKYLCFRF